MAYIEGEVVHDADAHVMEPADWLDEHAEAVVREAFRTRFDPRRIQTINEAIAKQDDPQVRARDAEEIMLRKNYLATGAFRAEDRVNALNHIGVATQLVFPTTPSVWLEHLEHSKDVDLLYRAASATNRAQTAFCAVDERLFAVGYVPLADRARATNAASEALELGCKALLIPWACPKDHATSHVDFDRIWAQAAEAGVPILFHVGDAARVLPSSHAVNGLPAVLDFHGGDENFRSVSYMAIPAGPMQALSLLIFDGVLERFPTLKIGIIELGAVWLPGYMRQLDAAYEAFARHEQRLQALSLKPSEYVARQVRVTPYPTEPAGWIIEQSAPEICMFSSDFPHVEGGRNPFARFERSLEGVGVGARTRFYRTNFEDMMGAAF